MADISYKELEEYKELKQKKADYDLAKFIVKVGIGVVVFLMLLIGGCTAGSPQYNLYKSNTEKKQIIGEAKARADAAFYEAERNKEIAQANADAEVIRAKGVAAAQEAITETLTPQYIQWLYVDQMDSMAETGKATIIYVPTEGGIPVMEAGRTTQEPQQ